MSWILRTWPVAVLLLVAAMPAYAQTPQPPNDSNIVMDGMLAKKPAASKAPDVPAPPRAWPRLDRGAVLCRSADDLARRAAILRGEQAGPADCRPIVTAIAIQIVQRAGPGRTEVKVTANNETGWTDAWLPATPPRGATPTPTQGAGQVQGVGATLNR
jgi:hypothetical protein